MDNKSLIATVPQPNRQPICTHVSSSMQTVDVPSTTANKSESENQEEGLSAKERRRRRRGRYWYGNQQKATKGNQTAKCVTYATTASQTDPNIGADENVASSIKASTKVANCKPEGKGCSSTSSKSNNQQKPQQQQNKQPKEQKKSAQPLQQSTTQQQQQPKKQQPKKQQPKPQQPKPPQPKPPQPKPSQQKPVPTEKLQHQNSQAPQESKLSKKKPAAAAAATTSGQRTDLSKVEAAATDQRRDESAKGLAPIRKYSPEQLLAALTSLDMNNNSKAAQPARQQADRNIIYLSNQSQYEIKAQILCEAIPFRLPKSSA